jgi:hypothetical protein
VAQIATGFGHTAATSASGALYEWGLSNHLEPAQIKLPSSAKNRRVTAVACGHHYTAAITGVYNYEAAGTHSELYLMRRGRGAMDVGAPELCDRAR